MISTAFLAHHSATPLARATQADPPIAPSLTTASIPPPPKRLPRKRSFVDQADVQEIAVHTLAPVAPTLVTRPIVPGETRSRRSRRSTDTTR
ncbi:unnamed protein product [Tuber melanosporum]|uniref:(Perigord truffle) hypothetical protein n=1 Tax=Tuber melanosporum (strain Mel28) TaxID=656061 RepID=D5G6U6_TUBMM|nr:uncharacterized protein GSTUM_00002275001 [Tuber melanosporum]CAZ80239.1 unnamed protein product [Tuber melanosporum]